MDMLGSSAESKAERINITLRSETRRRLNQARNKRAIQINVSAVCEAAITAELDRMDRPGTEAESTPGRPIPAATPNPGMAELVARMRLWMDSSEEDCARGPEILMLRATGSTTSQSEARLDWRSAGHALAMLFKGGRLVVLPPGEGPRSL